MKEKIATLIVSLDDKNLSNNVSNKPKIALDFSIILYNKSIKYFFNDISTNISILPTLIARSWYRNNNGIDENSHEYSLGMILEKRICLKVSAIIKIYFAFKKSLENYSAIEVPKNFPKYLTKLIDIFGKDIILIPSQKYSVDFEELFNKRGVIKKIKVNRLSSFFRACQKPFIKMLRQKTMLFPDWTYENQIHSNYIYQNKVNIFKSFYYKDAHYDVIAQKKYSINRSMIESLLRRHDIDSDDINNLYSLVQDIINNEIIESKDIIYHQYKVMKELIDYYDPSKVIIPDDGEYPWYNMLMQICDTHKIESITVLDGYLFFLDKDQIRIKADGVSTLVSNYATMGTLSHDLVGSICPDFNRILIQPPLFSYLSDLLPKKIQYDGLIMMPIPNISNLSGRWDMRYKYVIDLINLLTEKGFKNIAIKIKPGTKLDEKNFLKKYFKDNQLNNIDIIEGYAHDAINLSKIIIGQLGTTLFEASVMNKPYYIYEPYDCGLTDSNIKNSIVNIKSIARSINELSYNLSINENVKLSKKDLIDGEDMSSILN